MRPEGHLYLIGYRGTGKSSVAGPLGERLGREAIDLDARIANVHRRSVAELWTTWGEPYFRTQETILLTELSALEPAVIATGGGAVIDTTNQDVMRSTGWCAWLRATPETIRARLDADPATAGLRPPLDPALSTDEEIAVNLARRTPLYAQMATVTIDTDGESLETLVDALAAAYEAVARSAEP